MTKFAHTAALFLLACAACASVEPTRTGFLSSYEGLEPGEGDPEHLHALATGSDWSRYKTVVVDPVIVSGTAAKDDDARELAAFLEQSLREALVPHPSAGERELRVRAAVTDYDLVNPFLNGVSLAALWITADTGGASVELEMIDLSTGHPLYRLSAAESGSVLAFWTGFQRQRQAREALSRIVDHAATAVMAARDSVNAASAVEAGP